METVTILDREYNKTYTIPKTWATWAKQALVEWENKTPDGKAWFAFADTCPWPDFMDSDLVDVLDDGEFEIITLELTK